jgi:[glutamine synthetase] adenylyltransferase / [glutamine synthetase]-adenylyl-L-tyrosine phosphorylase
VPALLEARCKAHDLATIAGIFSLDTQDIGARQTGLSKEVFQGQPRTKPADRPAPDRRWTQGETGTSPPIRRVRSTGPEPCRPAVPTGRADPLFTGCTKAGMTQPDPLPLQPADPAAHSRFVQRTRRRYAGELGLLPPGIPDVPTLLALVQTLADRGRDLASALRVARHLVIERIACRDLDGSASLDAVTGAMTDLAEATLECALAAAEREADARFGAPLAADGQRVQMWIVGMGKLGARELNVSSDIDLIYIHEADGHTDGPQPVSLAEYFAFVARRLYALIGDTTDDGFVFRVDLALRPNGNSGPPVASLAMLAAYLSTQGREWERFAWLKSRVVAPREAVTSGRALALRDIVTPFVYRRYLDYGVFEGLRQLHRKIRDDQQRRATGRPERANDVKLGRGGIREIEFIVQLMLVVRGGQFPEIRTRSTLRGLSRLAVTSLLKPDVALQLDQAYQLLRRVEHRIQYLDDQQTHQVPTHAADRDWIARSLGLAIDPATGEWPALNALRIFVSREFDALLGTGLAKAWSTVASGDRSDDLGALPIDDERLARHLPSPLTERVRRWAGQPRIQALREPTRLRLGQLMLQTAAALEAGLCTEVGATRFADWIEPLLRRESYFALLVERPLVLQRLLSLLGLARWPTRYLMQHPGVIDELADEDLVHQRLQGAVLRTELEGRHEAWERSGEAGEEQLLDTLRRAHHAEVFRTLVRDVDGGLTVEQVADDLSGLADTLLEVALRWCWSLLPRRHREQPQLAVIAYGKLGGRELSYGSDLDLVFVYDDADEADPLAAQEVYGRLVRRYINWLTLRTAAGGLYDIDTALRPNGGSGLLVTSISAFENYQRGRGDNTAWTWEHQALTRARFAAGARALRPRFEATRREVLTAVRGTDALRTETRAMRDRLREAHRAPAGRFDIKHSPGGMLDVEFAVQFLVLANAHAHPALADNVGNIALLQRAEAAGLLAPGLGEQAADAYRELRRAQHQARLDEQPPQVDLADLGGPRAVVAELWAAVLG